jgi:hypothetical protein
MVLVLKNGFGSVLVVFQNIDDFKFHSEEEVN